MTRKRRKKPNDSVWRLNTNLRHGLMAFSALTLLSTGANAQEQDLSKVEITATQVSDNIYLLQGAGGNIVASIGEDGIVLIDDQFAPLAGKIAVVLKELGISDKPVRFIINTHYHFDHTDGNLPFANDGATIIAHNNVYARLVTGSQIKAGSAHFEMKPAEKDALPVITFGNDITVHLNGEGIRALHYPAGHTDGDAIIFFPKANVVHMGDNFVGYGFPFIDIDAGGSVQGIIKACEAIIAMLPPDTKVIPGHGDLSTIADVRKYVTMLKETSEAVEEALRAGKTLEQMKKENVLAAWSAQYSNDFINTDTFIETLYHSLALGEKGQEQ